MRPTNLVYRSAIIWVATNIGAGGNSTATELRAALFFILSNNGASYEKLIAELRGAREQGKLSNPVTWKECKNLPYLQACVVEAERLHPAIGLHLERTVPPQGATVCGTFVKGGTVVGMTPWVIHRDPSVFGHDADQWRPERWLCDDSQKQKMQDTMLAVGDNGSKASSS